MPMTTTTTTEELIIYSNSRNGLGIRILGAKRATNKSGIYIKQLLDDGLAQRDGRLKVGDQILSINDEPAMGISREHAVNILRSAAATNQVRLRIRHFSPQFSSSEYQKFLYEEKSTDDDEENHRHQNTSQSRNHFNHHNTMNNEVRMRKSSRRHHQSTEQQSRHSTSHFPYENNLDDHRETTKTLDISSDVLQSLLNSKFKIIDLVDLLKKTSPKTFVNDQKKELKFIGQLSETNPDGRISLKDFERQSSVLLGDRINLLAAFVSSPTGSSSTTTDQLINELRGEVASCRQTIEELQTKIVTCEKSQRLANEIELEYEDLLKFLYDQLNQMKINDTNQLKQLKANDQLIQKLFTHLSNYVNKPNDEQILAQLKFEYEQQQKSLASIYQQNSNQMKLSSTKKY